jgi:hypothetical protein
MDIIGVIILVVLLGALGGFANCLVAGEFHLPYKDAKTRVWKPGWIGTVLVGGIAAVLIWALYSPCASIDIIKGSLKDVSITISQLFSSLVVGLGGGRILMDIAAKKSEKVTRENLAKGMKDILGV